MTVVQFVEDEGVPLFTRHVVAKKHRHIRIVVQIFDKARHLVQRIGTTRLRAIVHPEGSTASKHQRSHSRRLRRGVVAATIAIQHPRPCEGR